MGDGLITFQVIAQVEHDYPPLLKVYQVIAQVECEAPPLLKVSQVIGQVEYQDAAPGIYVNQIIGQVEYSEIPLPRRIFPVPDSRTFWQSQVEKRTFPGVV